MRTYATQRTKPRAVNVAFGLGFAAGAVTIGLIANLAAPTTHHCYEDEAQIVVGQALACIPLDWIVHRDVQDKLTEHAEQGTYYLDWEYDR